MPLYEYCCADCEIKFSKLRSFSQADQPITCPECEGLNTRRAISVFAAVSRGTNGESQAVAGGGSGCAGCGRGSCAGCHH